MKTGVLIINLGTPKSPKVPDVRRYLYQFLNDYRVIDLPWFARKILVNLIIVPFRSPKSAKSYKKLWTNNGSPLLYFGKRVENKLQQKLGNNYKVVLGMRYQEPSLHGALTELYKHNLDKLIIFPMFPQYASSSTGSAIEETFKIISKWNTIPSVKIISQFFNNPAYINCFKVNGTKHSAEKFDHVLFSFHGLPVRHLEKSHKKFTCENCGCATKFNQSELLCYKNTCFETARLIATSLNLKENQYTTCFQSRLGRDKWIEPYTEETVIHLAKKGVKNLIVFSPAFVADCLETTIELGEELKEKFIHHGGETLTVIDSLNDNDLWIDAMHSIITGA